MDTSIKNINDIPHTLSYVIRKRQQIDNLSELPKEKRPPDNLIWHSNPDKMERFLDEVFNRKGKESKDNISVPLFDIEG